MTAAGDRDHFQLTIKWHLSRGIPGGLKAAGIPMIQVTKKCLAIQRREKERKAGEGGDWWS